MWKKDDEVLEGQRELWGAGERRARRNPGLLHSSLLYLRPLSCKNEKLIISCLMRKRSKNLIYADTHNIQIKRYVSTVDSFGEEGKRRDSWERGKGDFNFVYIFFSI